MFGVCSYPTQQKYGSFSFVLIFVLFVSNFILACLKCSQYQGLMWGGEKSDVHDIMDIEMP